MMRTSDGFTIFLEPARPGIVDEPTEVEAGVIEQYFQYLRLLTGEGPDAVDRSASTLGSSADSSFHAQ